MSEQSERSRTAIVTAWIALASAVLAAMFSAYTTIVVSNEKHSVERAKLFKELIEGLDNAEGSKSRLALLNLWQLYPDDHKVIVLASLEIGHSELVETMIRLDDEVKPYQGFLLAQAESKDSDVATSAKRIIEQLDPAEAVRIYVEELMSRSRVPIGDERIEKLIELVSAHPAASEFVRTKIELNEPTSPILEYVLYRALDDKTWLRKKMTADRIDELSDILCCGEFFESDQEEITATVLRSVDRLQESDRYAVSHIANFLNNNSLRDQMMAPNVLSIVSFGKKVVENEDYYYQARATALSAIAIWSPPDALLLIANRLADDESNGIVNQEISDLLNDSLFLRRAADAAGISPGAIEEIPLIDSGPEKWKQWRVLALDHMVYINY